MKVEEFFKHIKLPSSSIVFDDSADQVGVSIARWDLLSALITKKLSGSTNKIIDGSIDNCFERLAEAYRLNHTGDDRWSFTASQDMRVLDECANNIIKGFNADIYKDQISKNREAC